MKSEKNWFPLKGGGFGVLSLVHTVVTLAGFKAA